MLDLLVSYIYFFIISLSYIIKKLTFQPPKPPGYIIHKNPKNKKDEIFFLVQSDKEIKYEKKILKGVKIEYINLFKEINIKAEFLIISPYNHLPICIIYCHGNCGDIGYCMYDCYSLAKNTKCVVLSFEFPNYGSLKDIPFSEKGIYKSIQIAYIYANKILKFHKNNIFLYGFSLGTGIAFDLACKTKFPVGGLILQSPYLSIFRVVYDIKKSPFYDIFRNCDKAPKLKALTLFIHGNNDNIVPYIHGRILAKLIPKKFFYDFLTINNGGHLNLFLKDNDRIFHKIREFIGYCCRINIEDLVKKELKLDNFNYDFTRERNRNNKSDLIQNTSIMEENLIEETKSQSTLNKSFNYNKSYRNNSSKIIKNNSKKNINNYDKKNDDNIEIINKNDSCENLNHNNNDYEILNIDNNSNPNSINEQQSINFMMKTRDLKYEKVNVYNSVSIKKTSQNDEINNNKSFSVINKPVIYYNDEITKINGFKGII